MMKRFFTFLMAVWAFLSISQTVKAVDVTVYFQCPSGWGTTVHEYAYNSGSDANTSSWPKASAGSKFSSGTSLSKSVNNSAFTYTLAGSYNSNGNDMSKESTSFDFDGNETTGIKELETEVLNDNKYYNLQGIEVAYPVKGIYIHNGKKVIVK